MNKEYLDLIFEPSEYQKRVADFISEYSDVKEGHKYTDELVVREVIGLLVNQDIFNPIELQKQALRDYSVMIPLPFIRECASI